MSDEKLVTRRGLPEETWEPSPWALQAADFVLNDGLTNRIVRRSEVRERWAVMIEKALVLSEDEVWDHLVASMDITEGGLNANNLYRFYYSKFLMMRDAYRRLMVRYKKLESEKRHGQGD